MAGEKTLEWWADVTQDPVEEAKQEEQHLAHGVEELSPLVTELTTDIDAQPQSEKKDILGALTEWLKLIREAITWTPKDWSKAFDTVSNLFGSMYTSGPKKPSYRKAAWDEKAKQLTGDDVADLFHKIQNGGISPEKKLVYARCIAQKRDTECVGKETEEPKKTEEILDFQATKWRIQVGDIMIFWWPEQGGAAKELLLQAHLKSEYTHAAVVTSVDPLKITHATKEGVHELDLMSYIAKHTELSYAFLSWGGTVASTYAREQIGKPYDVKNGLKKELWDDQSLYCSELAIRSLCAANNLDPNTLSQQGKVFPEDILTLSYPKYVADYPRVA